VKEAGGRGEEWEESSLARTQRVGAGENSGLSGIRESYSGRRAEKKKVKVRAVRKNEKRSVSSKGRSLKKEKKEDEKEGTGGNCGEHERGMMIDISMKEKGGFRGIKTR